VVGVDGFVTDDSGAGSGAWSGSTVSSRTIPEPGRVPAPRSTVSSPTIPEPPR